MTPSATTTTTTTELEQRDRSTKRDTTKEWNADGDRHSEERQGPVSSAMPSDEIAEREPDDRVQMINTTKGRRKMTVLEQHCGFFDIDNDGVLWPRETYLTCRSFAWSVPLSLFFAGFLHCVQSWGTVPWWHGLPDPLFRIWVQNVHFNKHGSSTMAFDNEGTFRPEQLDAFFDKFDVDGKGGLTFWEGFHALRRIRMVWDVFGQVSAFFEWGFTYMLLWPEDGIVKRKDAHRVLDGSIFHEKVMDKRKQERRDRKANDVKSS